MKSPHTAPTYERSTTHCAFPLKFLLKTDKNSTICCACQCRLVYLEIGI